MQEERARATEDGAPRTSLASFDRRVLVVAAIAFAVLMGLSPFYGFDRDELYFLDAARHLQGGYVDQPILTPLLARVSLSLFGVSLPGLRLWPALAMAATVVVGALLAREFGGGRGAQLLAAIAVTASAALGADHIMGPTAFDILAWGLFALVVVHVGRTGNTRAWVFGGLVLGIGLANKHSIGFFAAAFVIGVLLSGGWRQIWNRWFAIGAVVALCFTIPDVWWQATHGWATVTMTARLNHENGGLGNIGNWVVGQLIMVSGAVVWVWITALPFLWRSGRPLWRALVWAYGLLFLLFAFTTGAKIYYLAGAYVYLLAAGAVRIEPWLASRPHRSIVLFGALAITTLAALPLVLPVLPASDIGWTYKVNQVPAETVGWPEFLDTVSRVWHGLPKPTRAHAVLYTQDYGEAGAINELGRHDGLPIAVSGQNNEWFWGPGNRNATTVIAIAPGPRDVTDYQSLLERYFRNIREVATFSNSAHLDNQEWHGHLYICTGLRQPWGATWPKLRHYD